MNYKFTTVVLGIVLIMGTILVSCSGNQQKINEEYFTDNCIVYNTNEIFKADTIHAEVLAEDLLGVNVPLAIDSFLVLTLDSEMSNRIELRNLKGDSITSIVKTGIGPDDVLNCRLNGNTFNNQDGLGCWIVDTGNAKLKRLNITKSLLANKGIIDSVISIPPMVLFADIIGDSLIQLHETPNEFSLCISEVEDYKNIIHDELQYNIEFNNGDIFSAYSSPSAISPDRQYLVKAMRAINQINILNIKDNSRLTVSIGNVQTRDKVLNEEHLPRWEYYSWVSLSNNRIFALYRNKPYICSEEQSLKPAEIHVFNYTGQLIAILPLDKPIEVCTYSALDNSIYGVTYDEALCRYKLPEAIK